MPRPGLEVGLLNILNKEIRRSSRAGGSGVSWLSSSSEAGLGGPEDISTSAFCGVVNPGWPNTGARGCGTLEKKNVWLFGSRSDGAFFVGVSKALCVPVGRVNPWHRILKTATLTFHAINVCKGGGHVHRTVLPRKVHRTLRRAFLHGCDERVRRRDGGATLEGSFCLGKQTPEQPARQNPIRGSTQIAAYHGAL